MECPFCGWQESEIYSTKKFSTVVYRYHRCEQCGKVWKGEETVIDLLPASNLRREGMEKTK